MRFLRMVLTLAMLSSCGQITRILDGTENLPKQIAHTNDGIDKTNESVRLQKLGEALKIMKDPNNRTALSPVPFDMMSAARSFSKALTAEEATSFVKNYLTKIRKQKIDDTMPRQTEEEFAREIYGDYSMLVLVAGNLPDDTVKAIIAKEANQGANQTVMYNMLKLRFDFLNNIMFRLSLLGIAADAKPDPITGKYPKIDQEAKLDTLGKINDSIYYNEKIEFICNLDFSDKVDLVIEGFPHYEFKADIAMENYELILKYAQADYVANSLSKDPVKNEEETKTNAAEFEKLITRLQSKVERKP